MHTIVAYSPNCMDKLKTNKSARPLTAEDEV
jgi:hypothetical protein